MQLHGPDDWTPEEEREVTALAKGLGIAPERLQIFIPVPRVDEYRERQVERAVARGEVLGS
jgi:hypothetical protein